MLRLRLRLRLVFRSAFPKDHRSMHYIRTLRPENLAPEDLVDVSHKTRPCVVGANNTRCFVHYDYAWDNRLRCVPFPERTRGFLYFHQHTTPLLGALRLRLAASPNEFHTSTDLLLPSGKPWGIPLMAMAVHEQGYTSVRQRLHADDLVSEASMSELSTLVRSARLGRWNRSAQIITALGDTFELDLATRLESVWILRLPDHLGLVLLHEMFAEHRDGHRRRPYTG